MCVYPQAIVKEEYATFSRDAKNEMLRRKLGLLEFDEATAEALYPELADLMSKSAVDYTLLWRQLSHVTSADVTVGCSNPQLGPTGRATAVI